MRCVAAVRLERQLKECQVAYENLRRRLEREMGTLSRRHYMDLTSSVDQAWNVVQQASAALEAHLREHSCLAAGASR